MPIPFELMDAPDAWSLENTGRTLELGARYLYDEVERIEPGCPLGQAVTRLGNNVKYLWQNFNAKGLIPPPDKLEKVMTAMDLQGNLGYSLWRLRSHRHSPGYEFELNQLAQAGDGTESSKRLLRSHGFTFQMAARMTEKSFGVAFCQPGTEEGPDFILSRDGDTFPCEATTKDPAKIVSAYVDEFWRHILNAVKNKKTKFSSSRYQHGVLLIDCSPIAHLMVGAQLGIDTIVSMEADGSYGRSDRLVRYDGSPFSNGVKEVEELLRGTNVTTVVLRYWKFAAREGAGERRDQIQVLGSIRGRCFWKHFESPLIFPGEGIQVLNR
jgi:hypothetical protein